MNDPKLCGGRILRSADPLNLEMPFEKLESFITGTVRCKSSRDTS
ncbi:hypothetical protein Cflav_PD5085 [Pedosphaera parvula Ellin514]|uniref:Uncharacterized protein n=1 Tax=Pedosphaera parvula (strain Ellin514) TaxID=320771 RepID=B9XBY2_PEDPL|nr:hypothetical protein Cflav_PD5085 [Pedosphaera parvula Ellin514]